MKGYIKFMKIYLSAKFSDIISKKPMSFLHIMVLPQQITVRNKRKRTLKENGGLHKIPEIGHTNRANASICCCSTCNWDNI